MSIQLKLKSFKSEVDGPKLLITGGVHGDEFEPIAAIHRLIKLFETDDPVTASFRGQVKFIPIVNEAAFIRGHRMAEDGLDLARVCPGSADGSITEQAAAALSEQIEQADYYIDLHTGGTELSVFPLAGYTLHQDPQILEVQRRMAHAFNLSVVWGTAGNLKGRSLSVARDGNVPAIYTEHLGQATCHQDGVDAYVDGCLNVMGELGMLAREQPASRIRYDVEDPRPGSGHMQVQNPSPMTGFFQPAVELGQEVKSGEPLGDVISLDGSQACTINAEYDGVVLVLRTFPRVRKDESIGVVMALNPSID
ncbi:MAG: succinylglutamate desuccinylase [Planctomycetaceae bacterium]|nr:succinylglutamate desuccinylase [Planctomycetaceae bacterium]